MISECDRCPVGPCEECGQCCEFCLCPVRDRAELRELEPGAGDLSDMEDERYFWERF